MWSQKILAVTHTHMKKEEKKSYNYDVLMHTKKDEKAKKAVLIGLDVSGKKPYRNEEKKKSIQKYTRDINVGKKDAQLRIEINYPTNHSIRRTFLNRFCVLIFFFLTSFLGCKKSTKTTESFVRLFLLF